MTKGNTPEFVLGVLEYRTQKYFEMIAEDIADVNSVISKDDAYIIRNSLGTITYRMFVMHVSNLDKPFTVDE